MINHIECGDNFSGFITQRGDLFCFGNNEEGQLGIGYHDDMKDVTQPIRVITDFKFTQISFGYRHTLLMTDTDEVLGTGLNSNFELGLGTSREHNVRYTTPVKIPSLSGVGISRVVAGSFSAAINCNGELFIWGSGEFGTIKQPQKLYMNQSLFRDCKITKFHPTESSAVALDSMGRVFSWGANQHS